MCRHVRRQVCLSAYTDTRPHIQIEIYFDAGTTNIDVLEDGTGDADNLAGEQLRIRRSSIKSAEIKQTL